MATLDELINRMYDMVQDAKRAFRWPARSASSERDQMLDLLDELRSTLPNDLQAAQDIVAKRNDLLASGNREAEAIRRKAEEDARQMVSRPRSLSPPAKRPRKCRATPKSRRASCAELPTSTARTPSSAPRRLSPSRSTRSARPVSASRASQSKHEDHGDCFAAVPLFLFRGKSVQDGKSTRQTSRNKCSSCKICSKSRIQSGKLLQNITN